MINDTKNEAKERMVKALEALGRDFNRVRTGRATPALLEPVRADYYGAPTPAEPDGQRFDPRGQTYRDPALGPQHLPGH